MESTPVSSDSFVRQILQSTVSKQMETDKKRMVALIQLKTQQESINQKVQIAESSLDVYA